MSDRPEVPQDPPSPLASPELSVPALAPAVWVTGLIVVVALLLALFASL